MNDIVKVIYVFKNDLPYQFVAIFQLSSKLTPCEVIFIVQPNSQLEFPGSLTPTPSEFPIFSVVGVWIFSGTTQ